MEIIKAPWEEEIVEYCHEFYRNGMNFDDGGFGFQCDEHGIVIGGDELKSNYQAVMFDSTHRGTTYGGIKKYVSHWKHGLTIKCNCGHTFELSRGYDTMCDNCGQWYNPWGQELRNDWQENDSLYDSDVNDLDGLRG